MSDYIAPVKDMRFVMDELAGYKELSQYTELGGSLTVFALPN